ncbi:hypothetical protein IMZ48_04005 [Candidatus Bathyarchaeota archaeon]|nr:hypothetical protein [Candidatus Bathyarchaeota archaeon]
MLFRAAVLGLAATAAAANLVPRDSSRQCAVSDDAKIAQLLDDEDSGSTRRASNNTVKRVTNTPEIEVDVYFHVVAASKDADDGWVTVRGFPLRRMKTRRGTAQKGRFVNALPTA